MNVLFSLSFIGFKVASTAKVILRTFLFQLLWVEEDPGYTWVEQLTFSLEDNGYECLICTRLTTLMWKSSSILFPPTLGFIIVYIQIKYHWILRKRGWAKIYHWTKWTSAWLDKNMRSIFLDYMYVLLESHLDLNVLTFHKQTNRAILFLFITISNFLKLGMFPH